MMLILPPYGDEICVPGSVCNYTGMQHHTIRDTLMRHPDAIVG
jgi:hypothetical protein